MKAEIPEFLKEMSVRLNEQDGRCTSHPFFQVRCKKFLVTEQGYGEHHYEIVCDCEVVFRSDRDDLSEFAMQDDFIGFWEKHAEDEGIDSVNDINVSVDSWVFDEFLEAHDLNLVYVQEVEEVVSTHLTEADAKAFIARSQRKYTELYTYAESAYWSNDLRQLQDWIKSLNIN